MRLLQRALIVTLKANKVIIKGRFQKPATSKTQSCYFSGVP